MDGIRTVKTNGSTIHHYTLNGSQIVTETWTTKSSSGAETPNHFLVYLYDENGAPVGLQYRSKSDAKNVFYTYYFEKNLQGDIIAIYTENGTKIGSYTYDAWGNCTVSTESGATTSQKRIVRTLNPFRYRGYYYDTETGLYYLQSRYYNPQWGRFLNADGYVSTGTGLLGYNMCAYCDNNPVNRIDLTGTFWKELWGCFVQTLQQSSGYFAVAAGISQADTPAPGPADAISAILLVGGLLFCAGTAVIYAINAHPIDREEEKAGEKDVAIPTPRQDPVHHIVAKADPRAAEARKILRDVGIEPVTDPRNLVVLPQSYHASLHTTAYHSYVTERLRLVEGDKEGVEATLASLRAEILARSVAGIRWD